MLAEGWDWRIYKEADQTQVAGDTGSGDAIAFDWAPAPGDTDGNYRVEVEATRGGLRSRTAYATAVVDRSGSGGGHHRPGREPAVQRDCRLRVRDRHGRQDPNLLDYVVEVQGPGATAWRELRRSTQPVADGTLGLFVARDHQVGSYTLRVTARDRAGNSKVSAERAFSLTGPARPDRPRAEHHGTRFPLDRPGGDRGGGGRDSPGRGRAVARWRAA